MRVFIGLAGILVALLGVVSACPITTGTTPIVATKVILGPRRNGFSDLPSTAEQYNYENWQNHVPRHVTASDPETGSNAMIYNRRQIYNAMREGYEVLQRTRDPEPNRGLWVEQDNLLWPGIVISQDVHLEMIGVGFGALGADDSFVKMYMWPLLWTDGWTGHNQNTGHDRVIFSENGVYMGVITYRPSGLSPEGGYRWCPPTDNAGNWIAQRRDGYRIWNYPGVPTFSPPRYMPPAPRNYNVGVNQLNFWYDMHPDMHWPPYGVGSGDINRVSPVSPPSVDDKSPGAQFDIDNPLEFPPADNSTGVWRTYVPTNATTHPATNEFDVPADCTFAHDHGAGGYHQSCQTRWTGGAYMQVRITVSGTGQNVTGWCHAVIQNMYKWCGDSFVLANPYACNEKYAGTVTFSKETDDADPEKGKYYWGIDMHFWVIYPWTTKDSNHNCMAQAVEQGSCGSGGVFSTNGKWCRNIMWVPDIPLVEWSNYNGP